MIFRQKFRNMNEKLLNEISSSLDAIRSINIWLPQAIDSAINQTHHVGTLDKIDIDRMAAERAKEEKDKIELAELMKQGREIQKQTKYLFWGMIFTLIATLVNIILQIESIKNLCT